MASEFRDQVAVVTGGAQGLGFGIAERLSNCGTRIALVDLNKQALSKARQELLSVGVPASYIGTYKCNVTHESDVRSTVSEIIQRFGKIDILVQSAGITGKTGLKTHEVDVLNFELVFRINSTGIFLFMKHVLPHMEKRNYGRIINIASVAGKEGNAGMLAYSASKAAEYAETGITINAIAPAVVRTALVAAMPPSQVKYMTDKIPMKRTGEISEIAALAAFIASKEASFTTGFTFDATGGRATY